MKFEKIFKNHNSYQIYKEMFNYTAKLGHQWKLRQDFILCQLDLNKFPECLMIADGFVLMQAMQVPMQSVRMCSTTSLTK